MYVSRSLAISCPDCARSHVCRPAVCAVVFVPAVFCLLSAAPSFPFCPFPFLFRPLRHLVSACPPTFQPLRTPLALAQTNMYA
eukprot:10216813-Heterocapsa_arctica.AAC.1